MHNELQNFTRNLFDGFKESTTQFGGSEIDYTEWPVACSLMRSILNENYYTIGSLDQLENIFRNSIRIVSAAAGSGRMDIVFNQWLRLLGNEGYNYKGFDIAPAPQSTRLEEWVRTNWPEMSGNITMDFECDFFDSNNYGFKNNPADLVIVHNALDLIEIYNDENFATRTYEVIPKGAYLLATMGGARDSIINPLKDEGFEEIIRVRRGIPGEDNYSPLVVLKK
jgi:hypothetical protein